MTPIHHQSAIELAKAIQQGTYTATEVLNHFLTRIQASQPTLNAFRAVFTESASKRAAKVDAGTVTGPLAGVPIAIKDCMCYANHPSSIGSKMLENFEAPYTATAVQRLLDAGAVIIGTTNMDSFAMGSSTETCYFGKTSNPWDTNCVPGGSSGGAASALAAGLAAATLGSDTGGSIRQPAAYNGVVGFKPTYGRISRHGLIAFASSLDQIGPLTHTVADAALLSSIMFGADENDGTSVRIDVPEDLTDTHTPPVANRPLRIGIAKEFTKEGTNSPAITQALENAIEVFKKAGAEFIDISLPHTDYGLPCYYICATAEASSNLSRYEGSHYGHRSAKSDDLQNMYLRTRSEGFGEETKRRIMLGTYALSSGYEKGYYTKSLQVRRLIRQDFDRAFEACDVILTPTTTSPAFKFGANSQDPISMYMSDLYTVTTNLAGITGISLPAGFDQSQPNKLPVGIQLIGKAFDECTVLRAAQIFEDNTIFHKENPKEDLYIKK